jgi:hypothetical protein
MKIETPGLCSPHPHDPVPGDGSSSARPDAFGEHVIDLEAGPGNGTPSPAAGARVRARPHSPSNAAAGLAPLLALPARPSWPDDRPAIVEAGRDADVVDTARQPDRSPARLSSRRQRNETRDLESGLPLRDIPARVTRFLGDLSVVQEVRQFDDVEFAARLRSELVTEPGCPEPKTLLAAVAGKVDELRSHLGKPAATPQEAEFLAAARRYLEPLIASFETDIDTLAHDASAAKRMFQGALTLLLYPLPLATLFTQKTGSYGAFSIASYTYTAIQLVSLVRRPTTDAKLFRKHAINRHSLVFFISLLYAVPTFYDKARPLQHNAGFVAGAAVAQAAMMFGLRLGEGMVDSFRRRFNKAFTAWRDLPAGFKDAIDGILHDLRTDLGKLDGFVGEFQKDRRITPHMDRQLTFFKQDMGRIVAGLEGLVATGTAQDDTGVAANGPRPLDAVRSVLQASFANNPDLKGKLAQATVAFVVLGLNIALMRNDGPALPDFIADAVVSTTFLLQEAFSPHVSLMGMSDSVSDIAGGMTIGLPFSIAAAANGYLDDPRRDPAGFAAGTITYTAAYMLFGRMAGSALAQGLMRASGALAHGQQLAIRFGRSAMALGYDLVARHRPPAAGPAQATAEAEVEMDGVAIEPLAFTPSQLASAERTLVDTLAQIGEEWRDALGDWEDGSGAANAGDERWFDAPEELPAPPAPRSEPASLRAHEAAHDS